MKTFAKPCELILSEEFKTSLPEKIVLYLNEQKVESLSKAAVLADEFVLTHQVAFSSARGENNPAGPVVRSPKVHSLRPPTASPDSRECFYCHEIGHSIAASPAQRAQSEAEKCGFCPICSCAVSCRSL